MANIKSFNLNDVINNLNDQIDALKEADKQNKSLKLSYQTLQQSYDKLQHAYNELNQSYEHLQKDINDKQDSNDKQAVNNKQAVKKLILEMLPLFKGHEFDDYIKQNFHLLFKQDPFFEQESSPNKKNSTDITKQYETLKKEYNELYSAYDAINKQLQTITETNEYLVSELKNYDLLKQFTSHGYFIDDLLFTQVINSLYTNSHSDDLVIQLINAAQQQDDFRSK